MCASRCGALSLADSGIRCVLCPTESHCWTTCVLSWTIQANDSALPHAISPISRFGLIAKRCCAGAGLLPRRRRLDRPGCPYDDGRERARAAGPTGARPGGGSERRRIDLRGSWGLYADAANDPSAFIYRVSQVEHHCGAQSSCSTRRASSIALGHCESA
jgi:hypothetical protein